ncbi:MAG: DUF429 domain-containing protein [Bryobacterales bacterium]|nr:DUF429 domain-containing protein [Bryobacterales bacterium]
MGIRRLPNWHDEKDMGIMRFMGIDFGWTSQPSGVASLTWDGRTLAIEEIGRISDPQRVLAWVDESTGDQPAMVAVDAPTVIVNPTGMREADRAMHVRFGKQHAGCYPANLGSAFAERTTALGRGLEELGFKHADCMEPQRPGRYQIEVYPHAAMLHLFSLDRILKYKKGTVPERRASLEDYRRRLMATLPLAKPRLRLKGLPEVPAIGREIKAVEDQYDAVLCAYIGAWWWFWGKARTMVAGNRQEGYIVVPVAPDWAGR